MAAAPRLLVCTRTTGYRHDSIPAAVTAVRTLGPFEVDATEDPAAFERPWTTTRPSSSSPPAARY